MDKSLIALDFGAKTGWAVASKKGVYTGMEHIGAKNAREGLRIRRLLSHLDSLHVRFGPFQTLYYEDVKRHIGTDAAHCYGAYRGAVMYWALQFDVEVVPLGVSAIKKFITGNGRAQKVDVILACRAKRPQEYYDDNEADALAALVTGAGSWKDIGI